MSKIKSISDRVSYKDHEDYTTIVISTKIERWKESLIMFWLMAWTFCGAYFIYELAAYEHDRQTTIGIVIMLAFWVYFEVRIGRAFLWRKHGVEFLKIGDNQVFYKRSIKGYGKAKSYFCSNIKNIDKIERNKLSPLSFLEGSSWFIGGETIRFTNKEKVIQFGMQLSDTEVSKLLETFKRKVKQNA